MIIVKPSVEILTPCKEEDVLKKLELIGRVCYKSEEKITENSSKTFVWGLIRNEHLSVIEHVSVSIRVICDRGISHELVRHRIASYSQESTRYCNYSSDKFNNQISCIAPFFFTEDDPRTGIWIEAMEAAEKSYFSLLRSGSSPQEARGVLPTALKTEIIMTMNLRSWRHFLKMRTSKSAHPQMQEIAHMIRNSLREMLPTIFLDV